MNESRVSRIIENNFFLQGGVELSSVYMPLLFG